MEVTVFGDLVSTYRFQRMLGQEDYRNILTDFQDDLKKNDYNIFNLESPVLDGGTPIKKIGPSLCSPPEIIPFLKEFQFNVATLANNHIMDYGKEGLESTLEYLKEGEIFYVGVGENAGEAAKPLILEKKGAIIGIINIAEHEFSFATKNTNGANALDLIQIYYQVQTLKPVVDKIFLIYHGGNEHYIYPSPRIQDQFRFFVETGVDVVISHHPHCYSGHEKYGDGLIFYGLGNFIFDKKGKTNQLWNYGYGVSFQIDREGVDFELIPYNQFSTEPRVLKLNEKERNIFNNRLENINQVIQDRERLEKEYGFFCKSKFKNMELLFEPYENRILKAMKRRKLLPSLLGKKKVLKLYNYLYCEAHKDVVDAFLSFKLKQIKKEN